MIKRLLVLSLLLPSAALAEPTPETSRGATFEANLGLGFVNATGGGMSSKIGPAYQVHAGLGGWIRPGLALTVRAAVSTISADPYDDALVMASDFRRTFVFLGPSLQYWIDDHLWLGGGVGMAKYVMGSDADGITGLGLDLRGGYSFANRGTSTLNVSLEVTPGFYRHGGGITNNGGTVIEHGSTGTGVALLVGYQYL